MTLFEWLQKPGNTQATLARLTGLQPPMVSKMVAGLCTVTIETAIRVDKGTNGEIAAEHVLTNADDALLLKYYREKNFAST